MRLRSTCGVSTDNDFTKILDWLGYRVYQHEIDERGKRLTLWVRRKGGNRRIECSGCGRKFREFCDVSERGVRDPPWSGFQAAGYIEVYRVKCPECGVKREEVPQLPSKAPFSKRFEEAVGKRARAPRRGKWRDGSSCRRARCEPSTCATWSDGRRGGGSRRCGRWE